MKPRLSFAHASRELLDAWISSGRTTLPEQIFRPALKHFTASMVLVVQENGTPEIVRGYAVQARQNAIADEIACQCLSLRRLEAQRQARPISATEIVKREGVCIACESLLLPQKGGGWCIAAIDIQLLLPVPRFRPGIDDVDHAILHLMYQGFSTKEMGQQIGLSHRTIEHRLERLKQGFGARTLSQLVALSIGSRIMAGLSTSETS